jgi:hypothetical protein
MASFNHFLLTKFNTRSFQNGRKGCDPVWLEERFSLFDWYCYPSVYKQSNQNFKWLVFFDTDTPEPFKRKIAEYAKWSNFTPVYVDCVFPYGQFPDDVRALVQKLVTDDCKYLITTWLDNDDAIASNYVQMIQDNFQEQDSETINFLLGYQLYNGKLYLDYEFSNHFISLVERYYPASFNTCLSRPHKELYEVCNSAKKVLCKPAWVEVVHGKNVANIYRKGIRASAQGIPEKFSISSELLARDENFLSILLERTKALFLTPYYLLRRLHIRIKKHGFNDLNISYFEIQNH